MHVVLDMHVHLVHDGGMKLSEYMSARNLTDEAFAAEVKRDRSNVTRWRRGLTKPDFDALVAIQKITEGAVLPSDFVEGEVAA